ncbi:glycosyltransferase [bacterium]|nr:glycosyltransferase [bacterium]
MKITLIASDESSAPLYRVRLLARVLSRRFDVEVLGFHFRPDALDPLAPRDFSYRGIAARPWPAFWQDARKLAQAITGDLIYAMKPRPTSYGLALALRAARGLPVVVDVDDWEPYMVAPYSRHALKNAVYGLPRLHEPNNYWATWTMDKLVGAADAITTVSTHFQRRYGGVLAPQYVDTARFDPEAYDREALRAEHGLTDFKVAVFAGIAQPNKGVGEIREALSRMGDRHPWRLAIVGPITPYAKALADEDERVLLFGTQPPEKTPAFLRMADVVALPQRQEPASMGQMPMKLYEAMAMACPVVSTAVSDIPSLLAGCGVVVPPRDLDALSRAIAGLLDDPKRSQALGEAARRRIRERYSYEAGAATLGCLFGALDARHRARKGRSPC